jgi:dihydrofolate synthase/folylpolyglutamate synthase
MRSYRSTLKFLYDLQLFGVKLGLRNIRSLLQSIGNPERQFSSIHIAGTNGKGSTAAMLAAILTASGYRTGLYTSPHLVDFSERIRIDGKPIPEHAIVRYASGMRSQIEETTATFFEATTAMAFQYFAEQSVDIAVVETGLGGRLDATNVLQPLASIITNIDLDHTEQLGRTRRAIAREKGGIIKPVTPCIIGTMSQDALLQLTAIACRRKAKLIRVEKHTRAQVHEESILGSRVTIDTKAARYSNIRLPLAGPHQVRNARLALLAIDHLKQAHGYERVSMEAVRKGMRHVRTLSGIRGRFDILSRAPLVIADVAHNPAGARTLVDTLRRMHLGGVWLVFGVMKDKDWQAMSEAFRPIAKLVVGVRPNVERALDSRTIVEYFHGCGTRSLNGGDVAGGVRLALESVSQDETIVITGSHYVVGEVLSIFRGHVV